MTKCAPFALALLFFSAGLAYQPVAADDVESPHEEWRIDNALTVVDSPFSVA